MARHLTEASATVRSSPWQILWVFLRLGLTSFGGPAAHLARGLEDAEPIQPINMEALLSSIVEDEQALGTPGANGGT